MAANTGKLAGRTAFITGASRGIGKAIALKLAKDGANVVIAAKTAEPHPKLPGTIYTAAKEVEALGGQALPCVMDLRFEDQVAGAVKEAVKTFGGIDILVNNASAVYRTGTLQTPMKRYDILNDINARGTYMCSHLCLPYLKKAHNPHILNITMSPNRTSRYFKNHLAYSLGKYGMSMCALGMAEEFRDDGIAVNSLWPRTAIYTAAVEVLLGPGRETEKLCRRDEIMGDAAYVILSKDARTFTGNFCMDDEVLMQSGVTDLGVYDCVPGHSANDSRILPTETMELLRGMLSEEAVARTNGIFQFDLTGVDAGTWYLDLKNGGGAVGRGAATGEADCTMSMDSHLFCEIFSGKINPTHSIMLGLIRVTGDEALALKLETLAKQLWTAKL